MTIVNLIPGSFSEQPSVLVRNDDFTVTAKRYPTGIESVTVENSRGHIEILPFMGQIIWDAEFDGISLRMKNMFTQPHPASIITETYGCFAFHSGLLGAGCPAPEDTHPMHGEFACAPMDRAWLEIADDTISVTGSYEYVMGFGDHYIAQPKVVLGKGATRFAIDMDVTNLSEYQPMPLQYMCHMNYAYVAGAKLVENLPDGAFHIRETIPAHVHPTPQWTKFNDDIKAGRVDTTKLAGAEHYDPEIVFFADNLPQYGKDMEFELQAPDGYRFRTEFSSDQFPVATRWILWNPDQQVAAFVLPGTSRPEGREAARKAGTLIMLQAQETKHFHVLTGLVHCDNATKEN